MSREAKRNSRAPSELQREVDALAAQVRVLTTELTKVNERLVEVEGRQSEAGFILTHHSADINKVLVGEAALDAIEALVFACHADGCAAPREPGRDFCADH